MARARTAATASSALAPFAVASAAASAQKPSAIATIPVSTTRTGTGASRAARTAASYVPDSSAERWSETISSAPSAASAA